MCQDSVPAGKLTILLSPGWWWAKSLTHQCIGFPSVWWKCYKVTEGPFPSSSHSFILSFTYSFCADTLLNPRAPALRPEPLWAQSCGLGGRIRRHTGAGGGGWRQCRKRGSRPSPPRLCTHGLPHSWVLREGRLPPSGCFKPSQDPGSS